MATVAPAIGPERHSGALPMRSNAVASSSKPAYKSYVPPMQSKPPALKPSTRAGVPSAAPALARGPHPYLQAQVQSATRPPRRPIAPAQPKISQGRRKVDQNLPLITIAQCHACARMYPMVPFLPDTIKPRTAAGFYELSDICLRCTSREQYQGQMRYFDAFVDKAIRKHRHPIFKLLINECANPTIRERLRSCQPLDIDSLKPMSDADIPHIRYDFLPDDEPIPIQRSQLIKKPRGRPPRVVIPPAPSQPMPHPNSRPNASGPVGDGGSRSDGTSSSGGVQEVTGKPSNGGVSGNRIEGAGAGGGAGAAGLGIAQAGGGVQGGSGVNRGDANPPRGSGGASGSGGPGGQDGMGRYVHPVEQGDVCPLYWMSEDARARKWITETFKPSGENRSVGQKEVWREYVALFRDSPVKNVDGRTAIKLVTDLIPGSCLGTAAETQGFRIFGLDRIPYGGVSEITKLYIGVVGRGKRRQPVVQTRSDVGWTMKIRPNAGPATLETQQPMVATNGMLRQQGVAPAPGPTQITPVVTERIERSKAEPSAVIPKMRAPTPPGPQVDPIVQARSQAKDGYRVFQSPQQTFQVHSGDIEAGIPVTRAKLSDLDRKLVAFCITKKRNRCSPEKMAGISVLAKPHLPIASGTVKQSKPLHQARQPLPPAPMPQSASFAIAPLPTQQHPQRTWPSHAPPMNPYNPYQAGISNKPYPQGLPANPYQANGNLQYRPPAWQQPTQPAPGQWQAHNPPQPPQRWPQADGTFRHR